MTAESLPRFHLAVPVDDLGAAAVFYGQVLGCAQGRSAAQWTDWNFHGHQLVTHLVEGKRSPENRESHNPVDGHEVPVPHFGLILTIPEFHDMADRLKAAGTAFEIEPYLRFAGEVGEQWTMFFHDPAGNAIEVKAFADDAQVFAV
ncbi:MAG: VOC family protein [Acidimicrobiaceae bacterium]|nr:VOC family protein [Acidimicrobiaceae bacterium]